MDRYRTILQRYGRDREAMAQTRRSANAVEMQTAQQNMRKQQQAFATALGMHDYTAANQAMHEMEDTLTAIEKLAGQPSK